MNLKIKALIILSLFVSLPNSASNANFEIKTIEQKILKVNPNVDPKLSYLYAQGIYNASNKHKISPELMISIIQVESSFKNQVSSTGDYSIAQINYKQWSKEFKRLNRKDINLKQLKSNPHYALDRMGEILRIKKNRHKNDPLWFARYHSRTSTLKNKYASKVIKNIKLASESKLLAIN